jgi:DNA-binding LacI/PurR family transcriptional regulator
MGDMKYEQVMQHILDKITDGEWKAGSRIFAERKIAESYGVSRITAQRAIDELVEKKILRRIQGRKGAFVADPESSGVDRKGSRLIGVAIDDISDAFGARILRGIEDCLWDKRYHTVVCNVDRNFGKVQEYFRSLSERKVDGVIFSPVIEDDDYEAKNLAILGSLSAGGTPYVLIDRTIRSFRGNFVSTDHRGGSQRLTERFIAEGGHKRLLLVTGLPCSSIEEREQGFHDAVLGAGLSVSEQRIVRLNDNLLSPNLPADAPYLEGIAAQIGEVEGITGIVALNGRLLRGAALVLTGMGYPLDRFTRPDLHGQFALSLGDDGACLVSTQPAYQLGYEAARLLIYSIESDGATMQIRLDADVIPFEG